LIDNYLEVHSEEGTKNGKIDNSSEILLTDQQAIYIDESNRIIFE